MSTLVPGTYDNPSYDLLAAFNSHFHLSPASSSLTANTAVLSSAAHIAHHAIDVFISMDGTRLAAQHLARRMRRTHYTPAAAAKAWHAHPLHPRLDELGPAACLRFIFTMDLLNFCFWSDRGDAERWKVRYDGRDWTGYAAMVAGLRRALDEGVDITSSDFWQDEEACTLDVLRGVFRSETEEEMPLLAERLDVLREAGRVLYQRYECSVERLVESAEGSAGRLVNILARDFKFFRDETVWEEEKVRFLKRAQIFVADLWACFGGEGEWADLDDVETLTAFADYRIPQMLYTLGAIYYSPPLETRIRRGDVLEAGGDWEVQIRGCSIRAVELIRREIVKEDPQAVVYPLLIDFFLYDECKKREEEEGALAIEHHRVRSVWY